MSASVVDTIEARKARGAFFTPPDIAQFLADWAVRDADTSVLDPTCGEAVFLLSAARNLAKAGASPDAIREQLTGVDLHRPSLDGSKKLLADEGFGAKLIASDFFDLPTPSQFGDKIGWQDAIIGNPPFVRYQEFSGDTRQKALQAALAQGVRLPQLASSWAPTLVHAASFLKPQGRMAMVAPAELLTVHYAEPVRQWLRRRFGAVTLVMFEHLQFHGADEQVVLVVAEGSGPCDAFVLIHADDAVDLNRGHRLDSIGANPAAEGKWSDLVLPRSTRSALKQISKRMTRLDGYGTPELGSVTGSNNYFAISEVTREKYGIDLKHLRRISPPGTKHLKGLEFSRMHWETLKAQGERVWLLCPDPKARSAGLKRYIEEGERLEVHEAYKCTIRDPWWRSPAVPVPDLFFTYMSHRYPRLVNNTSEATFLNSMHGVRLKRGLKREPREALPLLALNSVTMLGAETLGRAYGGGILKMEPREAASLPVPAPDDLQDAWSKLGDHKDNFDARLKQGDWWTVVAEVDRVLLREVMELTADEVMALRDGASLLRVRRTRQTEEHG
jgi:adenine-specific DNA-methyltransferase